MPAFAAAGAKAIVLVARDQKKLDDVAKGVVEQYPEVQTLSVATNIADPKSVCEQIMRCRRCHLRWRG